MAKYSQTRKKRKAAGLCVGCGGAPRPNRVTCVPCGAKTCNATREYLARCQVAGKCACGKPARKGHTICPECTRKKSLRPQFRTTERRWRRDNLCVACGGERVVGRPKCQICLDTNTTWDKQRRESRLAAGLCTMCGKRSPQRGTTRCDGCTQRRKVYSARQTAKGRAYGICADCGRRKRLPMSTRCLACEDTDEKYQPTLRQAVYAHYGSKCACCGEADKHFLSIDHVHNDGWKDRKERQTKGMYSQVADQGFPDTFQILCYNCNMAKAHYGGMCPHQWARTLT